MTDIEIEIDGQKLTAKPDQMLIQVADAAGIYIPRFCYHKNLSIAANCRMCLVEVEKSPKALPACATPVTPGMKVFTKSQKTVDAQRAVMEFLLINHPLDCPICDQGGECELQDLSMGYGSSASKFDECKRAVANENLGPLISTEMTRCILCTRCVRFGNEIAGLRELGVTFRGEREEISTFVEQAMQSEVSGNIIDLCPVGALTSKPFRFSARAWELDQARSVSPHDCVGTNLNVHTRYGEVMRVVASDNAAINETWIADRDRFSYDGLYHDRVTEPMVKIHGKWEVVDWQKAFTAVTTGLYDAIAKFGPDKFGVLASPNSTVEEFYLLQKIVRGLGSSHIDHRLRETDTRDQAAIGLFPGLTMQVAELEQCDAIFLIGSNIQKEQPIAALRVRKASLKGASVIALNPVDYQFNFKVTTKNIVAPHQMSNALAAILKALDQKVLDQQAAKEWQDLVVDDGARALAQQLQGKQKVAILLGGIAFHHNEAATIRYLAQKIASLCGAKLGLLTDGANSAGAWIAGAIPHRHVDGSRVVQPGLNAYEMLKNPRKSYLLLNVEPDFDCANAKLASDALADAKFVVALSVYKNALLEAHANVILPVTPFTETAGTFVNASGEWQSFHGVAKAHYSSRPAWKVLRVLGNFLHLAGFNFESAEEVKHEVKAHFENREKISTAFTQLPKQETQAATIKLSRIGEIPIYAMDGLVRRAKALQEAQVFVEGDVACIRIHPQTAATLRVQEGDQVNVKQQDNVVQLPVHLDERIALNAVWLAGGIATTTKLGDLMGELEIALA